MIYPWQNVAWRGLQESRAQQHHAILLHGPAGIGKSRFAEVYSQSLLCAKPSAGGLPCGECSDCRWFGQGAHPDFRLLTPEALRPETEAATEVTTEETGRGDKKVATQITIEQVRALQDFVTLSIHRPGGTRVVLIHPADAMNVFAANALLKVLEEPPARTVILLVTDELRRLIPTIISRCRRYPMPRAERAMALSWLTEQGVAQAEVLLAQAGGAPVAALALAQGGEEEERRRFLDQLARLAGPASALELAAAAQRIALPTVLRWLSTWCYDLMAARLAGATRYHPDYREAVTTLAARLATDQLLVYQDLLKTAARSVTHPLNPRLFLEQLLLSYSQAITIPSVTRHA